MYDFQRISLSSKQRRKPTITFGNNLSFQPITGMPIIQGFGRLDVSNLPKMLQFPSLFSNQFHFHRHGHQSLLYQYFKILWILQHLLLDKVDKEYRTGLQIILIYTLIQLFLSQHSSLLFLYNSYIFTAIHLYITQFSWEFGKLLKGFVYLRLQ